MRAVVFANGDFKHPGSALAAVQPGDLIIAADGGSRFCLELGLMPDVVIGDLDSLRPEDLETILAAGAKIIRYPARKDYTDLELALQYAFQQGVQEILVLAALGARWDQTMANFLLPAAAGLASCRIRLLDGPQEINLLRSGQRLQINGRAGDTLSLIPLGGDAVGIVTSGLEYSLRDETLSFGSTRGVSNLMLADQATISLQEGVLLCVVIHKDCSVSKETTD